MLSRKLVLLGILVTACMGLAVTGCGDNAITRPPADEQPLPAPDGITAAFDVATRTVTLSWLPLSSAGVAGYNVYRYAPSPDRQNAYVKITLAPVISPAYSRQNLLHGGDFFVRAVSASGLEGTASRYVHLDPGIVPVDEQTR